MLVNIIVSSMYVVSCLAKCKYLPNSDCWHTGYGTLWKWKPVTTHLKSWLSEIKPCSLADGNDVTSRGLQCLFTVPLTKGLQCLLQEVYTASYKRLNIVLCLQWLRCSNLHLYLWTLSSNPKTWTAKLASCILVVAESHCSTVFCTVSWF